MQDFYYVFMLLCMLVGFIKILSWLYNLISGKRKKLDNINRQIRDQKEYLSFLEDSANTFASDTSKNYEKLADVEQKLETAQEKLKKYQDKLGLYKDVIELEKRKAQAEKELRSVQKEVEKHDGLFRSMLYSMQTFDSHKYAGEKLFSNELDLSDIPRFSSDDLMCMQIKELRALYRANQKEIEKLVQSYQSRYTTKANAAIYQLMVLALEAEMKNILHALNYGKVDNAIDAVKELTARYYAIATNGNQTIASTLTKFIGQLEYFYIESVKIEYEYYVKRERAREEQRALKEQMRQEAEERKQLEAQRKKMEAEEAKYTKEMERISLLISENPESAEVAKLRAQLEKIQSQLADAQAKKEKIITLQNGKAGTVYVISNIGAFGENVFKIGMTRRDEPMDRIKELGDASVPFPFDVHCFIFSNDAVGLETKLHHILNNDRVNKVNLRKEFFRVDIDRLQTLVEELDPSAAFNRTALAEQFRQSLSIEDVPESLEIDMDE